MFTCNITTMYPAVKMFIVGVLPAQLAAGHVLRGAPKEEPGTVGPGGRTQIGVNWPMASDLVEA